MLSVCVDWETCYSYLANGKSQIVDKDGTSVFIRTASETARYLKWREGCLTEYSSVPEYILISK